MLYSCQLQSFLCSLMVEKSLQLYFNLCRDVDTAYLSVAPLQGGFPTYTASMQTSSVAIPVVAEMVILGGGVENVGLMVPNTDGYVGSIDRVVVNNEQLSLLLPNERNPVVTILRYTRTKTLLYVPLHISRTYTYTYNI